MVANLNGPLFRDMGVKYWLRRKITGSSLNWRSANESVVSGRRARDGVLEGPEAERREVSGGSGFCAQNQRRLALGWAKRMAWSG